MKVWLDDLRPIPDTTWTLARTADEAIAFLETGEVTDLSLDHDLHFDHYAGDIYESKEKTGYHVVAWLESRVEQDPDFRMPRVTVHSQNPVGRQNMEAGLRRIARLIQDRRLTP